MNSPDDKPIRYLTASDIYNINDTVTGGRTFVRDVNLLNYAVRRPKLELFGEVQYPTLIDKAAALLHSVAYHHLFADGNKRTAILAVRLFLQANGYRLTWDDATQQAFILEIAQGRHDVAQIAEQLAQYVASE
ncbi:MAG: type II toxin-antitoxin system death-on-curing family toxin [Anaerolineae bacterium]|nr:type II toxin-antitoxin system death-on-curing family toxin [Anaerolineae bacterium]